MKSLSIAGEINKNIEGINNARVKFQYDLYSLKHRNILWEIFIPEEVAILPLGGRHEW